MAPEITNFPCYVLDPSGETWIDLSPTREVFYKKLFWVCNKLDCPIRNYRKVRDPSLPMPVQLDQGRVVYCEGGGNAAINTKK